MIEFLCLAQKGSYNLCKKEESMIELLCIDVDGTMSDGKLYYSKNGEEIKTFNVKDGLALAYWHKIGRKSAIITGRNSEILKIRANELKIDYLFMGIKNKGECVRNLKKDLNLDSASIASIGDDMNDISMFRECGISFGVKNCANGIKNIANIILSSNGGEGAVREVIEMILKQEDLYEEFIKYW